MIRRAVELHHSTETRVSRSLGEHDTTDCPPSILEAKAKDAEEIWGGIYANEDDPHKFTDSAPLSLRGLIGEAL
jgi:hypothetical protein